MRWLSCAAGRDLERGPSARRRKGPGRSFAADAWSPCGGCLPTGGGFAGLPGEHERVSLFDRRPSAPGRRRGGRVHDIGRFRPCHGARALRGSHRVGDPWPPASAPSVVGKDSESVRELGSRRRWFSPRSLGRRVNPRSPGLPDAAKRSEDGSTGDPPVAHEPALPTNPCPPRLTRLRGFSSLSGAPDSR